MKNKVLASLTLPLFVAGFLGAAGVAYAAPTLSQTNVTIGLGQTVTIVSQGSTNAVYMTYNSTPTVATVQTNGTQQFTVLGNQIGGTSVTICYVGTSSDCTNLSVNVQSAAVPMLTFSQNNVTIASGQNLAVTVSGGNGTYSVSGNSNPSAASTSLNGNVITVTGLAAGSANINVCDSVSLCGVLYVTVSGSASTGSLTFSQTSLSISIGQIITINVSGGTGYFVSNNSNAAIASQTLNGNALTITGVSSGSSVITVCSSTNGCGTVSVAVGTGSSNTMSPAVTFGTTNPSVAAGQSASISLSGSASYLISSNSNTGVVSASVNSNRLVLNGVTAGSALVTVCATSGGCSTLTLTVTSSTTVTPPPAAVTPPVVVQPGATASNAELLAEIKAMQSQLAQMLASIKAMESRLTQLTLKLVVGMPATGGTVVTPVPAPAYKFTLFLAVGSESAEVTALQQRLTAEGFYSGPITGYYGPLTEASVKAYQSANGIAPAGFIGPSTRDVLNGA